MSGHEERGSIPVFGGLAGRLEAVKELLGANFLAPVDGERRVRRAYHVIVEVIPDLVGLLGRELAGVVERPDQADLLGAPPPEPHLVLDVLVLDETLQDNEEGGGPAPVVIHPRTCLHTIQMGSQKDDVVGVSRLGLGDDVPGLTLLEDGVDEQRHSYLVAIREAFLPLGADLERDHGSGDDIEPVLRTQSGATVLGSGIFVVQDGGEGAVGSSELQLVGECTAPALDERNLVRRIDALPGLLCARGAYISDAC